MMSYYYRFTKKEDASIQQKVEKDEFRLSHRPYKLKVYKVITFNFLTCFYLKEKRSSSFT